MGAGAATIGSPSFEERPLSGARRAEELKYLPVSQSTSVYWESAVYKALSYPKQMAGPGLWSLLPSICVCVYVCVCEYTCVCVQVRVHGGRRWAILIIILAGMIVAPADEALIISIIPSCIPLVVLLFSPFHRQENRGILRLSDWP